MPEHLWDDTKKAAWAKAELYAAAACRVPEIPVSKQDEVHNLAIELIGRNAESSDPSTLGDEVTLPLVGLVDEVGPRTNRTRVVTLLSGWAALIAAEKSRASVPVYPLPDGAREALTAAKLLHPKGIILDRPKAVRLLVDKNFGTAAELLGDRTDPIDADPLPWPEEEETPNE